MAGQDRQQQGGQQQAGQQQQQQGSQHELGHEHPLGHGNDPGMRGQAVRAGGGGDQQAPAEGDRQTQLEQEQREGGRVDENFTGDAALKRGMDPSHDDERREPGLTGGGGGDTGAA